MLSREKQEQRAKSFKQGISHDDSRRRREDAANEIRKNKREESLQKRRNFDTAADPSKPTLPADGAAAAGAADNIANGMGSGLLENVVLTVEHIPKLVECLNSQDVAIVTDATRCFRKLLSIERNPPISEVIKSGVAPKFVGYLSISAYPKLQFEAAWALTNIASGTSEQTQLVVELGAVPSFVQLLYHPEEELREQAVWALGNIAGDSPRLRDLVLSCQMMQGILTILNYPGQKPSMLRNATWALSNLCRGKPAPRFELVAECLPTLARLTAGTDQEVITDACWALSYVSDGTDANIQAVLESGAAPRMIQLLAHTSLAVQTPALRTVGNIVTGNDRQTQAMLDLGALPSLVQLLYSTRKSIRKEAAWTISNITAGNKEQTQLCINAGAVAPLVELISHAEFEVKREAAWALSNATTWKVPEQVRYVVAQGVLKPFCELLNCKDQKMILVCLEAIENILAVGEKAAAATGGPNPYVLRVEEADGLEHLENLQTHPNQEIYDRSYRLVERFFQGEVDAENNAANANGAGPMAMATAGKATANTGALIQMPNTPFTFTAPQMSIPQGGFAF